MKKTLLTIVFMLCCSSLFAAAQNPKAAPVAASQGPKIGIAINQIWGDYFTGIGVYTKQAHAQVGFMCESNTLASDSQTDLKAILFEGALKNQIAPKTYFTYGLLVESLSGKTGGYTINKYISIGLTLGISYELSEKLLLNVMGCPYNWTTYDREGQARRQATTLNWVSGASFVYLI